jgi:hypothetical protein
MQMAIVPEPGIVLRFSTQISAGKNFFGNPLSGGDHVYDPTCTRRRSTGRCLVGGIQRHVDDLPPPAPYLVPIGSDVMSVPRQRSQRRAYLNVVDQSIPVPLPSRTAALDNA